MQNALGIAEYHIKKSMEIGERVNDEDGQISNLIQLGVLVNVCVHLNLIVGGRFLFLFINLPVCSSL